MLQGTFFPLPKGRWCRLKSRENASSLKQAFFYFVIEYYVLYWLAENMTKNINSLF